MEQDINKLIRSYIVEIIMLIGMIIITYIVMNMRQAQAKQMCDVSSYEAYMNSKPWCDIITYFLTLNLIGSIKILS